MSAADTTHAADAAHPALLQALLRLEDLYHAASPAATPEAFEQVVAPDFWEFGASGRRFERAFCLEVLTRRGPTPPAHGWQVRSAELRRVGADHCLLVYTLDQPGRTTVRSTLWRRAGERWQAVFHQGTVVQP